MLFKTRKECEAFIRYLLENEYIGCDARPCYDRQRRRWFIIYDISYYNLKEED